MWSRGQAALTLDEAACDLLVNGYVNPPLNPKIGTGDKTSTMTDRRSAEEDTHDHTFNLNADVRFDKGLFCVALEATLFNIDGTEHPAPRHAKGYIGGAGSPGFFSGPSPHGFQDDGEVN